MAAESPTSSVEPGIGTERSLPPGEPFWSRNVRASNLLIRVLTHPEATLAFLLLASMVIFSTINHHFLAWSSMQANLLAASFIGIAAIGQGLLLLSAEFDLSVGSNAALAAVLAAILASRDGVPVVAAMAITVCLGALIGLFNGIMVVFIRLPALIVTLGMLFALSGIAYVLSGGSQVFPLAPGLTALGGKFLALPISIWIFVVLTVCVDQVVRRAKVGRAIYATGGNRDAATLAGIRTGLLKLSLFVITGALAAFAGLLVMAEVDSGDPSIGSTWVLSVIASAVIGGVSLWGGVGTIAGVGLGVLFVQVLSSGLVFAGVAAALQPVAVGAALIAALLLDGARHRVLQGTTRRRARAT